MKKQAQLKLLKNEPKAYGGYLRTKRKGRRGPRPLDTRNTMHLMLKSSKATGKWSFAGKTNREEIKRIVGKFAKKYGVQIISMANVGNHLHFHFRLGNRFVFERFIRAITGAIAMAVTGASRWNPLNEAFWDYRPFTRVIVGFKAFLRMQDYIEINELEAGGVLRAQARWIIDEKNGRDFWSDSA